MVGLQPLCRISSRTFTLEGKLTDFLGKCFGQYIYNYFGNIYILLFFLVGGEVGLFFFGGGGVELFGREASPAPSPPPSSI